MDRWTLKFSDRELELASLDRYFRTVRIPIRVAYLLGIAMWILWGLVVAGFLVDERAFDVVVRYAVLIPLLVVGLASGSMDRFDVAKTTRRSARSTRCLVRFFFDGGKLVS